MTVSVEVVRGLLSAVDRQRAQRFSLPETTPGEKSNAILISSFCFVCFLVGKKNTQLSVCD